jgi:hypothetical protein
VLPPGSPDLSRSLPQLERNYLVAVMTLTEGRILKAAKIAGVSRRTLLRKLDRYQIDKRAFYKDPEALIGRPKAGADPVPVTTDHVAAPC